MKTTADFDASMSKVAAVSGATGEDFDALRAKAREMGSQTKFSASEAADAMNYMAMAGWKTGDMLEGIEGIMNLAAASGEDLATTSDIVTDALTAFGLSAADSGHFADVLAAASSNANTNVSMMGETFKYCAPVAGSLGFSCEDTAQAIGLMANSSINGSQSGTALRSIMTALAGDVKFCGDAFGKIKIATTNTDGSMRELNDILADCRTAFSQLSESEQANAAKALVGKNAMSGFLALMNAAPADIEKLEGAISTCSDTVDGYNGVTEKMAAVMQDNLSGQITILKSQLQELAISFGEILMPAIRSIVSRIQGLIDKFNALGFDFKNITEVIKAVWDGLCKFLKPIFEGQFQQIANIFKAVTDIVLSILDIFVGIFTGDWSRVWDGIKGIFSAVWNFIKDTLKNALNMICGIFGTDLGEVKEFWVGVWTSIKNFFVGIWTAIYNSVSEKINLIKTVITVVWNAIHTAISTVLNAIWSVVSSIWNSISAHISAVLNAIYSAVNSIWNAIRGFISSILNTIFATVANIWNSVKNAVTQKITAIKDTIVNGFNAAVNFIKNLASQAFQWGADIINGIVNGITYMLGSLINTVADVARSIWEYLHFSVPDKGPLTEFESWMPDFMKGLADGINKSKKYVEKAISGVADAMTIAMNSDFNADMSGVTGAMAGAGGTTVVNNYNNDNSRTVNQTNNSPKSLSRLEIYRQMRNALNV